MKVKNVEKQDINIINAYVEVWRSNSDSELVYFVHGVHDSSFCSKSSIIKGFTDVDEALAYADDLKRQIAGEVFSESSLTCGV